MTTTGIVLQLGAVCVACTALWVSVLNYMAIVRCVRNYEALGAAVRALRRPGEVLCSVCAGALERLPWAVPGKPSWWCTTCHEWREPKP